MHQRLAAGEHDRSHTQSLDFLEMALEFGRTELARRFLLPDIAHHAAAVAAAVGLENQDGQAFDPVRFHGDLGLTKRDGLTPPDCNQHRRHFLRGGKHFFLARPAEYVSLRIGEARFGPLLQRQGCASAGFPPLLLGVGMIFQLPHAAAGPK
jgi:hypothetical protein